MEKIVCYLQIMKRDLKILGYKIVLLALFQ